MRHQGAHPHQDGVVTCTPDKGSWPGGLADATSPMAASHTAIRSVARRTRQSDGDIALRRLRQASRRRAGFPDSQAAYDFDVM